jgi:hypothetical protein
MIKGRYQELHDLNDATERGALANKKDLGNELNRIHQRLEQLAPVSFAAFITRSLDPRREVGTLLALSLIGAQFISSVSATTSSVIAGMPAAATATVTLTPATPLTPTIPFTGTVRNTSTATAVPSETSTPLPTSTPPISLGQGNTPQIPVSGGGGTGNCDPSYPGVCIPPPPPDLDCKDIPYRRFQVLAPDPHNFDNDGDGIGCES